MSERLSPVHPGEILLEEYVHGKRAITADTALRLARFFSTSERFWLNLQVRYDLEVEKDKLGEELGRAISPWSGLETVLAPGV